MESADEQQFCLRWNNFQANITSQFETLRDDEDFTDVTIACDGQKLQAHKVVLSACSPYFKELFKSNPCSHPIIFMRDVEARHVVALMEFMYAGEVNVAQAHLSAFLKTAESLKIRGLTDTTADFNQRDDDTLFLNPQSSSSKTSGKDIPNSRKNQSSVACSSAVTSSQDVGNDQKGPTSPPPKKQCKPQPEADIQPSHLENSDLQRLRQIDESISVNPFALGDNQDLDVDARKAVQPKIELPDYLSDDDRDDAGNYFPSTNDLAALTGGMEIIPQNISSNKEISLDHNIGSDSRKLHSLDPRPCEECGRVYSNLSNLRQHMKLIHYPTFVSCPICTKSFKTDLYLRRHMITTHETSNYKHTVVPPASNLNRLDSHKFKHVSSCGSHVAITKTIVSNNINAKNFRSAKLNTRSYNNYKI